MEPSSISRTAEPGRTSVPARALRVGDGLYLDDEHAYKLSEPSTVLDSGNIMAAFKMGRGDYVIYLPPDARVYVAR